MTGGSLTKSQANRAGRVVRRYLNERRRYDDTLDQALEVVVEYRAAHQYALTKATAGLRSMVKTEGCEVEVSQRLKRLPTIIDKLGREPTMALGNMQDIAGCRAVLRSVEELRRVKARLKKNRPPIDFDDYVLRPRASGYRAVHVIVAYPDREGLERAVEVQLRTRVMHEWAYTVEALGGRLHADLKTGSGPREVLEFLAAASEAMAIEERGEVVSDEFAARIRELRQAALPYIPGRR